MIWIHPVLQFLNFNQVSTVCKLQGYIVCSLFLGGGRRVELRCWVNFQCRGVLLVWMIVEQGPIVLAVGAGGGLFGHFFLSSIFSLFFLPLFGRRPNID